MTIDSENLTDVPRSHFLMLDLVGCVIDHVATIDSPSANQTTNVDIITLADIPAPTNSQSKTGLVMLLAFANLMYIVLIFTLLVIFARLVKSKRDPSFMTTITFEERVVAVGWTSASNFIFL